MFFRVFFSKKAVLDSKNGRTDPPKGGGEGLKGGEGVLSFLALISHDCPLQGVVFCSRCRGVASEVFFIQVETTWQSKERMWSESRREKYE